PAGKDLPRGVRRQARSASDGKQDGFPSLVLRACVRSPCWRCGLVCGSPGEDTMAVWALAKKETVLLARDWRASVLLLLLPLVFLLVRALLRGEAFGKNPDDRIRFMIVALDRGPVDPKLDPGLQKVTTWSQVVRNDLAETAEIRMEVLDSEEEARRLVA